jgi:hypothetical protein
MNSTLTSLLPFIIGSAVVPLQIIVVTLLLTSEQRGPLKAIAFVLGMTLARLAQGVLFGFVLTGGSGDPADAGNSGVVQAVALTVLGILLLITAYKKWAKEPDPDAPPPKWLGMIESVTPLKALLLGAGFILIALKLWVFILGAISTIGEAQLGRTASIRTFLLFILLAQSLLIIPIVIRLLMPRRAEAFLASLADWLKRYNDPIVIAISLIFGALFLYQGLSAFF